MPFSTRRTKSAVQLRISNVLGLDDGGHRVAALAQARAVHPVAVVDEHQRPHDAAGVLGAHVELLAQGGQRDLEVLDERVGFVLAVERVLVRVLHRVLGAVVDLAERGGQIRPAAARRGRRPPAPSA